MNPTPEVLGDGRHFPSQLIFGARRLDIPYEEWVSDWDHAQPYVGQAHYEVTKKDHDSYTIRRFAAVDLSGFFLGPIYGVERRMRLPDVLHSIDLSYEKGGGSTDYFEAGSGTLVGDGGIALSVGGSAQASAFCIPKLIPQVTETWSFNPEVENYFYYGQAFDKTTVLAKLSAAIGEAILPWPVWKPESLIFKLIGQRTSATARASAQGSRTVHGPNASSTTTSGFGFGVDIAPIIETQTIGPTLHEAMTLSPPTDSQGHVATTIISIGTFGGGGGVASAGAFGSVTPTSISATSPTGLPTSGRYVFDFDITPDNEFGWYFAHAIVFNFAILT